jgi:ankyrin repeat protein
VNAADERGMAALHLAAMNGHVSVVDALLPRIVDVNVRASNNSWKGMTALHMAAEKGHVDVVKLLLKRDDINVNIADACGMTALHWAAMNGHAEVVELLLEKDAKVNTQMINGDWKDRTPLDLVKFCPPERRDAMRALLRAHGAKTGAGLVRSY